MAAVARALASVEDGAFLALPGTVGAWIGGANTRKTTLPVFLWDGLASGGPAGVNALLGNP